MPFHVMLIPTLGCPANCSYCWSSEEKSPIMKIETIKEVVEWLKVFRGDSVTFTFMAGNRSWQARNSTGKHFRF